MGEGNGGEGAEVRRRGRGMLEKERRGGGVVEGNVGEGPGVGEGNGGEEAAGRSEWGGVW